MRYVQKDPADIPPLLAEQRALDDLEKIAVRDPNITIQDKIYKGEYRDGEGKSQSQVRDYLNKYYNNKCAYCEDICKAEIEHYRPKKAVAGDPAHEGYYWLCYEWSNLLPSCRYCNTEGGKGNKFPIINTGKRVRKPSFKEARLNRQKCRVDQAPLISEKPYLLHPEVDKDPTVYFSFKISDKKEGVEIVGIDAEDRGNTTIDICNLNRTELKLKRLEAVYYGMKQVISNIFEYNASGLLPDNKLGEALVLAYKDIEAKAQDDKLTHTMLRRFIIADAANFEQYFSPYLENESMRAIAVQAFKNYKQAV